MLSIRNLLLRGIAASASFALAKCQNTTAPAVPTKWGLLAMPGVDMLDIYGPIEILYFVAGNLKIDVTIITPTSSPVVITPPQNNPYGSIYGPQVIGNATFDDDLDLDILLVPGGAVARAAGTEYIDEYILKMFPKVEHFMTVCTGAKFAARAGIFDGKRATTNKGAWSVVTPFGNNVTWVAPARFVRDGNIWSSSGVSSGIDMTFAFVKEFYGQALHDRITVFTEIVPRAHDDDPFTDIVGLPHTGQLNQTASA